MQRNAQIELAQKLEHAAANVPTHPMLVGFDGFVDEIVRLIDKKESAEEFTFIPTIEAFAERLRRAAGKSTNLEMWVETVKLGGNGPIMANALAAFGLPVTYIGSLGYPQLHPVFEDLAQKATVYSIADPGHTDALEFKDGKVMLGKYRSFEHLTFANIVERIGETKLTEIWQASRLIGIVNWTMILNMTQIWKDLLDRVCKQKDASKIIFFDLADPEKRLDTDILEALEAIGRFAAFYRVILGCNEKESTEIARVLGIEHQRADLQSLQIRAAAIREKLGIDMVVIHPVKAAVVVSASGAAQVRGPYVSRPMLSTGGGDHFNAGFCLGALLGYDLHDMLLSGVATSGYYVRHGVSPSIAQLGGFLRGWE